MRRLALLLLFSSCAASRPVTLPLLPPAAPLVLGVDTHLHLTMSSAAKPLVRGEPGDGILASSPKQRLVNSVAEAQLHSTGVRLVFGGLWPPYELRPSRTSLEESLHQLRELDDFTLRRPGFGVAGSAKEARHILESGRIAVLPQVEGGEGITKADDVDALYAGGARVITVVHFVSTQLGAAAHGQVTWAFFRTGEGRLEPNGLTTLGRQVITRMMDLGVVIDLAHASDAFVRDVLALTEPRGVPVVVSHTGARAYLNVERNLSDELAQRVAASGGLIGVTLYDQMLATPPSAFLSPRHQPGTCDDLVAHWKHFASVVPPEALVFGSDVNGFITRPAAGGLCPDGVRNYGDLNAVWSALEANGVPRAALDGMGERLLKLVETVEAKADPAQQAAARRRYARVSDERSTLDVP